MPIGGLGEVGRNMTLISCGGDRIVVDCGVGFPRRGLGPQGVEQLLPDVEAIGTAPIAAVLLTHGHDDHVAALGHLIRTGAPIGRIVTLPFTAELVRAKLAERELPVPPILKVNPGQKITTGAFGIEFVRVSHSIPDAAAIAITTPVGVVIVSGDYKLDTVAALPSRRADLKRFDALGRAGVLALMADSTNADKPGRTPTEDATEQPILETVEACSGRVILTSFASHIDRLAHAVTAAGATRRRIALLGRSMRRNVGVADQLGELDLPMGSTVPPRELSNVSPRKLMVLCTGSQAERFAVLGRASRAEHPQLTINGTDTVIFATRPVPGNEEDVEALQAALLARGTRIVTHRDAAIHVSGHAGADEVAELIRLVRPRFLIPMHGERHMLEAQARIAVERCGMHAEDVLLAEDGDVITLGHGTAEITDHLKVRTIHADADGTPLIDEV